MKSLTLTKILIGPSSFAALDHTPIDHLVAFGCEIIPNPFNRKLTKGELLGLLDERTIGLVAGLEPLDREVLEKSHLKAISRCGSGLANVDLIAARDLGINVCSTPKAPTVAVAEITLGVMLSLLRMVCQMNQDLHEGKWTKKIGVQLEGKTVVIIGFGRIGKQVASFLASFNAIVLAVDPYIPDPCSVPVLPLHEALPQADILTIHCPGETCILGEKEFSLIKPGAFLLNAGRGGLVDEVVLLRALEEGRIAGAWLDTFEQEPYVGPLKRFPQVILTPHIGSYTAECRKRMEMEAVDNLIAALAGK